MSHRASSFFPPLTLTPLSSPKLEAQLSFTLIWLLFTYAPVPGSPSPLVLPLFTPSPWESQSSGTSFVHTHTCSVLHGQHPHLLFPTALCWGSSSTRGTKNLTVSKTTPLTSRTLSCCFHPFISPLLPQVPVWQELAWRPSPASLLSFFDLKLLTGRPEEPTAHLGPGCQEHGCHCLVSLSEKGWS